MRGRKEVTISSEIKTANFARNNKDVIRQNSRLIRKIENRTIVRNDKKRTTCLN